MKYLIKGLDSVAIKGNRCPFVMYELILKATIKPPKEKPKMANDKTLTSPMYSGVKNKYGIPYFIKIPLEITATIIDQIMNRIGLFLM